MAADTEAAITAAIAVTDRNWKPVMKISTEVVIPASLSTVWGALIDFPRYRSWHPIVEIEGSAKEGADVEYYYRSNSESPRGMSMTAKIKTLEPTRELCLEFGVSGFAVIEERYVLLREGTQVRVIHSAVVRGILPRLAGGLFRKRLTGKFQITLDWLARHLTAKQILKSGRKV